MARSALSVNTGFLKHALCICMFLKRACFTHKTRTVIVAELGKKRSFALEVVRHWVMCFVSSSSFFLSFFLFFFFTSADRHTKQKKTTQDPISAGLSNLPIALGKMAEF